MRILVVSDSHGSRQFMCRCVDAVKPDLILHLGDYYDDGEILHETYPQIRFLQVAGNCDVDRTPMDARFIRTPKLGGVRVYMTHGHIQHVKSTLGPLVADGRRAGAGLIVFGHTHVPYCDQTEDGIWIMNPGTCGRAGKTAGIVEIEDGQVRTCRVFEEPDLRSMERPD